MKIAVFGGSSPSGKAFIEKALTEGHELTVLARDPQRLVRQQEIKIITGDATNAADIDKTIAGNEAVISYLGPKKGAAKNMLEISTGHIIDVMKQQGLQRIIIASVAGIPMPEDPKNNFAKVMGGILRIVLRNMFEQREKQIALLQASKLNWTALRLPRLVDDSGEGNYKLGHPQMSAKLILSRQDLAAAMLEQLTDSKWIQQAPIIADQKAF